ncbi:hypothetical protein [Streptomyces sp. NBC_00467]|uniref:hypothetical protein n=1 Tax=Streptomyces sp. NBC_00467 TaxID=2975752 RepID=UPI002E190E96
MTKTQRILTAVALAAGATAMAASGAHASGHTEQAGAGTPSLNQLDQLNQLGQLTGVVAPMTGVLGAVQ